MDPLVFLKSGFGRADGHVVLCQCESGSGASLGASSVAMSDR